MCWSHSDGVRDPRSNRVVTAPVRLSPHTDKSISRIRFIGHERDKVSEKSALSEARRHKRLLIFGWFNGTDYRLAWIGHTPKYRDITDSHHIFSTLYLYFFIFPFCFFFFYLFVPLLILRLILKNCFLDFFFNNGRWKYYSMIKNK